MTRFTRTVLAAAVAPLALSACAVTPERPAMDHVPRYDAQKTAVDRARIRDLSAEVDGQAAYLEQTLGLDRSYILDMGDALLVTLPGDGAFEGRSDRLTEAGVELSGIVAASLEEFPHSRVSVIGHVDGSMSDYSDKILSDRRAVAMKSVMTSRGVDACRLGVLGKGSTDPVAPPVTDRRDQFNSRVEILVKPLQDGACT